jgi:phage tail-like protein
MSSNPDDIRAWFTIEGPNIDFSEFVVSKSGVSLGRGAETDIRLDSREVSRRHLHIFWGEDDRVVAEDLDSGNGVYLNEIRLTPNIPSELHEGDVMRLGPYLIRFQGYLYGTAPAPIVVKEHQNGALKPVKDIEVHHLPGIPRNRSTWMQYLPGIFSEDEFIGRYLLIFESIFSPLVWLIDNFDLFISPQIAPSEWLQWMASWFDILLLPELPIDRQRQIMDQIGWLFMRRGTPAGLSRLLELYYDVTPEIIENEPCHFIVRLPLKQSTMPFDREVANRLIMSQKPAFAAYTLEIE